MATEKYDWRIVLLIVNAIAGICWLEFALYSTRRIRQGNEEIDKQFPAWRRHDAKKWQRLNLYPGAMTMLIPRASVLLFVILFLGVFCKIALLCHNLDKPLTGARKVIISFAWKCVTSVLILFGYFGWKKEIEYSWDDPSVDYSYYLGPEWRKELKEHMESRPLDSTLICNHTAFFDCFLFVTSKYIPAFTPSEPFKKIPIVGSILISLQCLFADRGASLEARESLILKVVERQNAVAKEGVPWQPLLSFAEGVNTNNTAVMRFRRGAFMSDLPVRPCAVTIKQWGPIIPCYDIVKMGDILCFIFSSFTVYQPTLHVMPPFIPNEYLFKNHVDKEGPEHWQATAWATRDIICKVGGWQKLDQPVREKLAYQQFMQGSTDTLTVNGTTYTAKEAFGRKSKANEPKEAQQQTNKTPLLSTFESNNQQQTVES